MEKVLAFAVLCADGEIHGDEETLLVITGSRAEDYASCYVATANEDDCGPHRVCELVERKVQL